MKSRDWNVGKYEYLREWWQSDAAGCCSHMGVLIHTLGSGVLAAGVAASEEKQDPMIKLYPLFLAR